MNATAEIRNLGGAGGAPANQRPPSAAQGHRGRLDQPASTTWASSAK